MSFDPAFDTWPGSSPVKQDKAILSEELDVVKAELAERDAMLHGVLTALTEIDNAFLMEVRSDGMLLKLLADVMPVWYDNTKSGVCWMDVQSWWLAHQEQDRRRREQEVQEREQRRQKVLAKLTAEERELLGIKE